jgi:hypothetical protein
MTQTSRESLTHALRRFVERYVAQHGGNVDPHLLVEPILQALPPDLKDEAARRGVLRTVTEDMRFERAALRAAPTAGRSWRQAATPDVQLGVQYCVSGVWKTLSDCSRDDVAWLVAYYRDTATRLQAIADELEAIGRELTAESVNYVRDLRRFREEQAA